MPTINNGERVYVHDFVRQKREELSLSQQELADKSGVSLYVIKRMETAKPYDPLASKYVAVASGLGIQLSYLIDNCDFLFNEK